MKKSDKGPGGAIVPSDTVSVTSKQGMKIIRRAAVQKLSNELRACDAETKMLYRFITLMRDLMIKYTHEYNQGNLEVDNMDMLIQRAMIDAQLRLQGEIGRDGLTEANANILKLIGEGKLSEIIYRRKKDPN